jgi:hypothetical protein
MFLPPARNRNFSLILNPKPESAPSPSNKTTLVVAVKRRKKGAEVLALTDSQFVRIRAIRVH